MAYPQIEGYIVAEKIGSGSYANVFKAYRKVKHVMIAKRVKYAIHHFFADG